MSEFNKPGELNDVDWGNHFEAPPPLPEAVVCVTKEHMDAMEAENARLRRQVAELSELVEESYGIGTPRSMRKELWDGSQLKQRLSTILNAPEASDGE